MKKTTNYQLNQWDPDDKVLRTDFNADNAKIDAAIKVNADAVAAETSARNSAVASVRAAIPRIAAGSYTGDGAASRTISLGFTPKAVLLFTQRGSTYVSTRSAYHETHGGLAVTGHDVVDGAGHVVLSVVSGGFRVALLETNDPSINYYAQSNSQGAVYHYLAFA